MFRRRRRLPDIQDAPVTARIIFLSLLTIMTQQTKAQIAPAGAMRSHTIVHAFPGDFRGAETENLEPAGIREGVFRAAGKSSGPVTAVLTSPPLKALFRFDRLLLTAGASMKPGDELSFQAQVKAGNDWSPWFDFGTFSPGGAASAGAQENAFGKMAIDTVVLKTRAEYLRYRVTLSSKSGPGPVLRTVSAVYTDASLPYNEAAAVKSSSSGRIRLDVPQYSQMLEQVKYSNDICSPTSLAMALNYFGVKVPPLEAAALVYDHAESIYGNWSFNAASAGSKGLYAWLTRLNSLEEAREHLAAGVLLVASLTYGPDELSKSPLKKTAGHLLVIKGFDAKGNVIANDPAAPDGKTVERVYDRKEFARAWLKNKFGTAYALTPAVNDLVTARPPFAEMFSMPAEPGSGDREKLIETQVLPGERARLIGAGGGWLEIEALEQPRRNGTAKGLAPYRGWIEARNAVFAPPGKPDAVVKKKVAAVGGGTLKELSIGVKLRLLGGEKGAALALLAGGDSVTISEKDINRLPVKLPPEELRKNILATAREFLGDKYYWGGRSGFGADCSGLVGLAYRAWGEDLPRNASDQFTAARSVSRESIKPADLIFSTAPADRAGIDHVMLYAGNGRLIEATRDTDSVREVSFREKFGIEFDKAKNGQAINGKKVYFRRILK